MISSNSSFEMTGIKFVYVHNDLFLTHTGVVVRFDKANDTVPEDAGSATITIVKEGDSAIPVSVTVTTSDGTATGKYITY